MNVRSLRGSAGGSGRDGLRALVDRDRTMRIRALATAPFFRRIPDERALDCPFDPVLMPILPILGFCFVSVPPL
jgi:hypothetical protein